MLDQGYDLSEIFDGERLNALADALGVSKDQVLIELMEGLNSRYPDESHTDTYAKASAIRDLIDEGWVTPDNLDSLYDEGNSPGIDSNGNDFDDDDEDFDDDDYEDDDGYDDYEDDDDDDEDFDDDFDEEEDEDDPPSDKRIKDKKSGKGCVSDETMKNIVGALAGI